MAQGRPTVRTWTRVARRAVRVNGVRQASGPPAFPHEGNLTVQGWCPGTRLNGIRTEIVAEVLDRLPVVPFQRTGIPVPDPWGEVKVWGYAKKAMSSRTMSSGRSSAI